MVVTVATLWVHADDVIARLTASSVIHRNQSEPGSHAGEPQTHHRIDLKASIVTVQ